ncbi:MAG: hypothetical protein NT150_05775 [Bacteroidetes bacterium]|nr:hypothetical protein [Bacteroidota bacterium]
MKNSIFAFPLDFKKKSKHFFEVFSFQHLFKKEKKTRWETYSYPLLEEEAQFKINLYKKTILTHAILWLDGSGKLEWKEYPYPNGSEGQFKIDLSEKEIKAHAFECLES